MKKKQTIITSRVFNRIMKAVEDLPVNEYIALKEAMDCGYNARQIIKNNDIATTTGNSDDIDEIANEMEAQ